MSGAGEPIKILLADDHTLFREGVAEIFAADAGLEVVGEAENGEEAVALAQNERPAVVLLDIQMPGHWGAEETLKGILRGSPSVTVVVLTIQDGPGLGRSLVSSGAHP